MAIESDNQGADARLAVQFYKRSVPQEAESQAAGRPIFKEFDFIRILVPGDSLSEIDTYVREEHKNRFPIAWANYQNKVGNQEGFTGTPIAEWTQVSRSQADELRGLKFYTVESVANCSDQQLQRIGMVAGMSPHSFREKAKAYLNLASDSAEIAKREEELNTLREENAQIKLDSDAKLSKMQDQLDSLMALMPKPQIGRPKKEAVIE